MKKPIFLAAWCCCFVFGVGVADEVPSGHRVALLLGNADYEGFKLPGVTKSLDVLEQSLDKHGFRVVRRENLNQADFQSAIDEFVATVPTAGVALVYYTGLGAHAERFGKFENLLRPVKTSIGNDGDYRSKGVNLDKLVESFREQSGARKTLLFLDACWESPLKPDNGNVHGGLHDFEVSGEVAVMFAAPSAKTVAILDNERPSPMAAALTQHMNRLDTSVEDACQAISAAIGGGWFAGDASAIGTRPVMPVVDDPQSARSAGDGYVNSVGMAFRWCPPGNFTMGSPDTNTAATADRSPVPVTLSQGFWMGEHEVTQREYSVVLRKNAPIGFTTHKNAPFWGITEAKHVDDFCNKLTELERKANRLPAGWEYACPTEAQWEYACRAGSESAFCCGDSVAELGLYGNFADHALWMENPNYYWADRRADDGIGEALATAGSYRPNAWGIRDMHGNVAEIVADHLLPALPGGTDPLARVEKDGQTQIRGGAWCSLPLYCESSFRNALPGRDKHNFVGFRVVLKKAK